jgi:hypothetical protein
MNVLRIKCSDNVLRVEPTSTKRKEKNYIHD